MRKKIWGNIRDVVEVKGRDYWEGLLDWVVRLVSRYSRTVGVEVRL